MKRKKPHPLLAAFGKMLDDYARTGTPQRAQFAIPSHKAKLRMSLEPEIAEKPMIEVVSLVPRGLKEVAQ